VPLVAVLDSNVIWSAALRDTLLRVALEGVFQPAWTDHILDDMIRTLHQRRPHLNLAALERTAELMRRHFPAAMITRYEHRIAYMQNDPGDRHVLAAAVHAGAANIVTWNTRHFPPEACAPYGVEVLTPDEFLCRLWQADPAPIVAALHKQAAALHDPPQHPRDILNTLQRSVPRFSGLALASGELKAVR
jgi:predicted nucleic acid-binding protein